MSVTRGLTRGLTRGVARRVAGCDLGKSAAKLVVATVSPGGELTVESVESVEHLGRPLEVFAAWYRRAGVASCGALGATGVHATELAEPALAGLPEDACLEASLRGRPELAGPLNLVRIGARGYSVLVRDSRGRVQYLENEKCSAGTGETMVKIAGRFGLDIGAADRIAREAGASIPITARCSVFAKSEMTHFGNQGRPRGALFRGYFASVASYVAALLARGRVDGPVVAIGGGARIGALVDALAEAVGAPVIVPQAPLFFEAMGAAWLALDQCEAERPAPLPADPGALIRVTERRFRALEPAKAFAAQVERLPPAPVVPGAERQPAILGLDLGSTGSKAVLTSIGTGEAVLDLYDRTRGNPVEAATRLIATLLERSSPDVRAVGVTGSGREAVATVMRAAWPELVDRIVVVNEIVAHATAAIRCDEEDGRSLSVVEIGGQDAKFIQIAGGQIVESDMNKACSAGTGSFLEEQAVFYGIDDIEEFTRMAREAERPPDLGQMCTVFVAEAAAEARNGGFGVEDLFGGFQYSVVHNYINRVMGQRTFAERIFFQGKPASGESLAWTLAAVTGRKVLVPANPGAMGAWGVGLCARRELAPGSLLGARPFDLRPMLRAEVVSRTEIQCRDPRCATLCSIEKTTLAVGAERRTVLSGGACPKYEVSGGESARLPVEAPSAFDERRALLRHHLRPREGAPVVGVPLVGSCAGYLPWLATLLAELGLGVRVLESGPASLSRGEERCYSYDACAPAKIAHGVLDADVATIFFPKILTVADPDGRRGTTCSVEQGLPEMVREALRDRGSDARVVHPVLDLGRALRGPRLVRQLLPALRALGADARKLLGAVHAAARAQAGYEEALRRIGARTLDHGRDHGVPVIVLCGSLHVIHDPAVNARIPRLLRENGVLALPMDCFAVPDGIHELPRVGWGDAKQALRVALAARDRGGVYPLMLTSFGCGPASFVEQIFGALMDGYPHTVLESDGHGGTAGYITRVQAFLHTVRKHDGGPSPVSRERLVLLEAPAEPPLAEDRDARLVLFSMTDGLTPIMAAVYRSYGFDARCAPPTSAETLSLGRRDCSGKECLPYQLVWGSFRQHLEAEPPARRTVLLQISGEGRCRNCMFSVKDTLSLERMGVADRVRVRHVGTEEQLGLGFAARTWVGVVAWDLLHQLAAWVRPLEAEPGEVDALYARYCAEVESVLERPAPGGLFGSVEMLRGGPDLRASLRRASADFARVARRAAPRRDLRTVLLTGDIYVRLDDFAGDSLTRRLNARGLRVLVEPATALTEYFAEERLGEIMGLPTGLLSNALVRRNMKRVRRALYEVVRAAHPWLPEHEVTGYMERAGELLDRYPQGEAPVTIGSVLHHHAEGLCDGAVIASPWGCGPALVGESLLRHQTQIPMLFVYSDGSPIDERRLNAFAFRLRRKPRRAGPDVRRGRSAGRPRSA